MDVPTLLGLGLDEPLAEVWMAMAAAPGVDVPDLAEMVGISEAHVREVLTDLADRALIRTSHQLPGVLLPIEPEAARTELIRRQQLELAEQQQRFAEQREHITRVVTDRVNAHHPHKTPTTA
ncbi:hypothetical protein ACFQ9X_48090 [Catenulispora yoronensis]